MKRRGFRWLAAGILLSLMGMGSLVRAQEPRNFTLRLAGEPATLDWNVAHTMIETYLLMNLMEGLVGFDSNLKPVPSLAQSWKVSPDGKTYTFRLKPGVKWSDGVPLRARDFVFSWKRLLSPLTAASYAYLLFDIEGAEAFYKGELKDFKKVGVEALDDHTLQVKLVRPLAYWLMIPTFWVTYPLREDILEKHGAGWASPGRMVTVGPFNLNSHDLDTKIVLRANPYYHGQRGNIEQVTALIVKDDATALNLYESGRLDFLTDISTLDLKRLAGRTDLRTFPYLKTGYLGFLTQKYPVSSPRIRRAIAMAIDKARLREVLHGGQQAATSFAPPGIMGHSPKVGLPFDPLRAKAEIKAAGVDPRRPLKVELILPNWDKQTTLAQFIQAELKKNLGIETQLQAFDHKTFRSQVALKVYPLFEASWSADFPDPDNFYSVFLSESGNNRTGWKNPRYDALVAGARGLADSKARVAKYRAAERILLEEDAVLVPLYYEPNMALVKPRVKGLELNPLNYLLLRKVNLAD